MGFRIRNLTKDTMLCEKASMADSFWKRARGLMFQRGWQDFDGLLLAPCRSIHTMGMRMKIDVCFLDSEHRVTKSFGSLGPWRSAYGGRASHATLELPTGVLERSGTGVGDCLRLEPNEEGHSTAGPGEGEPC
jgi:hypothetical protein